MRRSGRVLAFALLALLAAGPHPAFAGNAGPAAADVALDSAFLIGVWTDDNDCSNVIALNRDGGFIAANGGIGLWNLDGDRLTMTGSTTVIVRIVPIDRDTITVINGDGSLGRSTRCPTPDAAPRANDPPVRADIS